MTGETVLLGEFSHETNTFAPEPTGREDFRARKEYVGEEIAAHLRGTNSTVGGALEVGEAEGVNFVPTVAASATPGGVVTADAYDHYTEAVLGPLRERADEVDGVFLSLHGAMVPEGGVDGEGPLLSAVREVVGPDVPVVATLDLHGNVTDEMCDAADALVSFEEYPHTDTGDTGRTAMTILLDLLRTDRTLTTHVERPPMLPYAPFQNTGDGPMAEVEAVARDVEERPGVAKVNVFAGFHKADVPTTGSSVVAVADDPDTAREASTTVAEALWERRESFVGDLPTPAEAVAEARASVDAGETADGPVVLADTGDNPGGGGTGDTTALLAELLEQGVTNAGLVLIHDPDAVAACVDAGVGERVSLALGGTRDPESTPVDVDGYVAAVTDGEYRNTGPMGTGTENHLGRTVRLQCGADDGVAVVVSEMRLQPLDAELWRHVGRQPERFDVVVVKSNNHYRADYEPLASAVVPVNSPGLAAYDPHRYTYEQVRRPKFPIDEVEFPESYAESDRNYK
ncbi:MAG: M81 family metallopeptidase [Haloarculaceae archaeon]